MGGDKKGWDDLYDMDNIESVESVLDDEFPFLVTEPCLALHQPLLNPPIPLLLFPVIHPMVCLLIVLPLYLPILLEHSPKYPIHILHIQWRYLRLMNMSYELYSTQIPNQQVPLLMIQQMLAFLFLSHP